MEQTKTKEVNTASSPSKKFDKEKTLAYVVLGFLGLVAFGFGGSQYTYLLSAIGFLVAIAILALLPYKASPKENKALLYYAIPLGVFAVFDADELAGFVHDGAEQVRLKIVFDALDH